MVFDNLETAANHNPFDEEIREMAAVERGDEDLLRQIVEETYNGNVGASFLVAVNAPAEDAYYYICCALCAFGAAVTSFGLIRYYNLLATRPLPSFYDRTGGNDDAKK